MATRELSRSFATWVEENRAIGVDGSGNSRPYVPYSKLEQYADHDRVASFLGALDNTVEIDYIRSRCLQVFFILVYISRDGNQCTDFLLDFLSAKCYDSQLPLPSPPPVDRKAPYSHINPFPFPDTPDGISAWQAFCDHQWKFLPLRFVDSGQYSIERRHEQTLLDPRQIRPITIDEELPRQPGSPARLFKVTPHPSSGLPPEPIVLKEYLKSESEYQFLQERRAYTSINNIGVTRGRIGEYFLRYHGSFKQGDKCVILVEYADQRSLLDFFRASWYLPRHEQEARILWKDLSQLCIGLAILHSSGRNNLVIHQDIKPANIFVFRHPDDSRRLLFKFGDFGMASVRAPSAHGDAIGQDNHGSKMYSAPETCQRNEVFEGLRSEVTWAADVWSLGCVLFEVAVWMATFQRGREEFRQDRVDATKDLPQLIDAGYRGAFHDGDQVLPMLRSKVQEILELRTPVARMSAAVMKFVLEEMLLPWGKFRLNAEQLRERFCRMIDNPQLQSLQLQFPQLQSQLVQSPQPQPPPSPCSSSTAATFGQDQSPVRLRSSLNCCMDHDRVDVSDLRGKSLSVHRNSQERREPSKLMSGLDNYTESGYAPEQERSSREHSSSLTSSKKFTPASSKTHGSDGSSRFSAEVSRPEITHRHSNYPFCPVSQVIEWIPNSKRHKEKLGGMEDALNDLTNRDQVFIIDNSASMAPYWEKVKLTAHALSYIVKGIDPDGFDIRMTNTSGSVRKKKCEKLFDDHGFLEDHRPRPRHGRCRMEKVLSNILPAVVSKASKPSSALNRFMSRDVRGINVYIMTDGVWEANAAIDCNDEAGGVENTIETIVQLLKSLNLPRTFLSIQFIRFGDDRDGEKRMRWLDDGIKERTGGWDIVDTTHHSGSVWKMIVGATSAFEDNIEDRLSPATDSKVTQIGAKRPKLSLKSR